jgi:hypothetical protein
MRSKGAQGSAITSNACTGYTSINTQDPRDIGA